MFETPMRRKHSLWIFIQTILASKPHNPHYLKRYLSFIEGCREKNSGYKGYAENHHICPKAKTMFPEYKCFRKNPWNRAVLTARQHYIAHILLARAYGGAMWIALDRMTQFSKDHDNNRNYFISSKIYERIRKEKSAFISEMRKKEGKWSGKNNPMYGKGKSNPLYGIKRSDETRALQSKIRQEQMTIVKCPKCGKSGEIRAMKIWHFENCGKVSHNNGSRNGKAKRIAIYDKDANEIIVCHGNFSNVCKSMGIPYKPLRNSYMNGGVPIMTSSLSRQYAKRNGVEKYIGWFAKIITN